MTTKGAPNVILELNVIVKKDVKVMHAVVDEIT